MKKTQKRIITINDISCIGKCSITVVHPILSSVGFETIILPTSLLSFHTAFDNFTFLDLTSEMENILNHWKYIDRKADALVSGYLANIKQVELVKKTLKEYVNKDGLYILDPVMADNGKLYKGFPSTFPTYMKELVKLAHIIIPNITEACLLLNKEYKEHFSIDEIKEMSIELSKLGPEIVIITGVEKDNSHLGASYYEKKNNTFYTYFSRKNNKIFHGTGDVFTSTFVASYLNNKSLLDSLKIAVDFTYKCIKNATYLNDDPRFGVPFEQNIKYLIRKIGL